MVIKLVFNLYQNSLRGGASKKNAQNKRKKKKKTKQKKTNQKNITKQQKQSNWKTKTQQKSQREKNKNNANWLPMLILKDTLGTSAEQMKNRETIQF